MFRHLALLVTLAVPLAAQSPLDGLRTVRAAISVSVVNGPSPVIDTTAISSAVKATLRTSGLRVMDRTTEANEDSPLVFFGVLVSVVKILSPNPVVVYAVRYEYTVTENARLARAPSIIVPVASWSAGGAVQVVSDPNALSGIIEQMGITLSQKLNRARGKLGP